uniref:cannabinoid receptor 1 isoform X1 n=1 Tax=Ciona intestinalis TaxID=7719 RepID=UPI00089DA988|nr:cannabinoid receptor 1 isoform X1 [Ciona intestinalis]|eukprot:XP_002126136.2 cannabinoid receptor 1 isoform X1 [Ciona intestinalis]
MTSFQGLFNTSNLTGSTNVCVNTESWGKAITAIAGTLIVLGNFLVVVVLMRLPARRFRPLHWFIVQLAVADFFVGLIVLWIGTFSSLFLDTVSLMSGIATYGVLAAATSTSTLGVLFIAVDRHFYILRHRRYKQIMTRLRVGTAIVVACVVPATFFVVVPAFGWNCIQSCDCRLYNIDQNRRYCFGSHCSQMMTPFRGETVLGGGICLLLLLVVSVSVYVKIFVQVRFLTKTTGRQRNRRNSEMQMIKTMLIVLSGFVFTTGPLAILCVVSYFHNVRELHNTMRILVVISTINSILNPIFYFWRIPDLNSNLRIMIRDSLIFCCPSCFADDNGVLRGRKKLSSVKLKTSSNPRRQNVRQSESSLSLQFKMPDREITRSRDNN